MDGNNSLFGSCHASDVACRTTELATTLLLGETAMVALDDRWVLVVEMASTCHLATIRLARAFAALSSVCAVGPA